jgi:SAM-dependent methyltransferase
VDFRSAMKQGGGRVYVLLTGAIVCAIWIGYSQPGRVVELEHAERAECGPYGVAVMGECLKQHEFGKYFLDPCNPEGQRIVKEAFLPFNKLPNRYSRGLGHLERHRVNCLALPYMLNSVFVKRLRSVVPYNSNSTSLSYVGMPLAMPFRVLAFGPQGEQTNMRMVAEASKTAGNHPVDYIVGERDPLILSGVTGNQGYSVDAQAIPFPDGFFDVVFFSHVMEHVDSLSLTMSEIRRVLHPDGFAVVTAPLANTEHTFEDWSCTTKECRTRTFGQADHVRRIGRDYVTLLSRHFGSVFSEPLSSFVSKKHPEYSTMFRNKEFQPSSERFTYVYKSPAPEMIVLHLT